MKLEICIDSLESAKNAIEAEADRLEICGSLDLDGISPSLGLVSLISKYKDIEKFVMIRPRPYDFSYSDDEFETMKEEIKEFKKYDIDGFVFGILKEDGRVDLERTRELVELASPLRVCFHRAFDYSTDSEDLIKELIDMGIIRLLTSGKKAKAIDGIDLLRKLEEKYGEDIEIMAGSGVNPDNIEIFYKKAKIKSFHMSAKEKRPSQMDYLKNNPMYQDITYSSKAKIKEAKRAIERIENIANI